jgi:hypothetical protein
VVTRYSNLPVAIILALHFIITRAVDWTKGERAGIPVEVLSVALGAGLPMMALLLYNFYVFGSPLDYGYHYTPFPVKFAYEYLGQVNASGQSIPLQIILDNLKTGPIALLAGFPLLVIGVPGIIAVLYFKFFHKKDEPTGKWSSLREELPWDIMLVLIGWFLSVYVLYMTYEFTAEYLRSGSSFFRYARYYLPGLFPVAIVSALVISRFPQKLAVPIAIAIIITSSVLYTQVALNPNA